MRRLCRRSTRVLVDGVDDLLPEWNRQRVAEALADDRFLILPHPEVADYYLARASDTGRWIASMNKLQRKIEQIAEA